MSLLMWLCIPKIYAFGMFTFWQRTLHVACAGPLTPLVYLNLLMLIIIHKCMLFKNFSAEDKAKY